MSTHKAQRVTVDGLTSVDVPILSKITIHSAEGSGDASSQDIRECAQALESAILENHEGNYAQEKTDKEGSETAFLVASTWEPPYKIIRSVSAKFSKTRITMIADAFRHEYWLARALYEGGRAVVDEVLTMNDGHDFETLFYEIHGESHADWKVKNKQGQVRGGFAWGAVDDYSKNQSELGKAEGQE
ncbi:MAG: hypothetical protein LBD01_02830 [Puniceicoccales bacterium]|jgi:hypothetical protein|nr:hypothetical protein [Puniceicoccales bacterium]